MSSYVTKGLFPFWGHEPRGFRRHILGAAQNPVFDGAPESEIGYSPYVIL